MPDFLSESDDFFVSLLIAACSSITCSNGGTCYTVSTGLGWVCACRAGYSGDRCQSTTGCKFRTKSFRHHIDCNSSQLANVHHNLASMVVHAMTVHLRMVVDVRTVTVDNDVN